MGSLCCPNGRSFRAPGWCCCSGGRVVCVARIAALLAINRIRICASGHAEEDRAHAAILILRSAAVCEAPAAARGYGKRSGFADVLRLAEDGTAALRGKMRIAGAQGGDFAKAADWRRLIPWQQSVRDCFPLRLSDGQSKSAGQSTRASSFSKSVAANQLQPQLGPQPSAGKSSIVGTRPSSNVLLTYCMTDS